LNLDGVCAWPERPPRAVNRVRHSQSERFRQDKWMRVNACGSSLRAADEDPAQ
jgi:hypothetical protein